jgi:hypothetical protein
MISITLDLGNVPSVLAALADGGIAQRVANAAAESYVDDTLDCVAEGKAFKSRTGQLEQSIGWRPAGMGLSEVYANAAYAPFVEHGTAPHVILPRHRKALKIPVPSGGYILRRQVNHPGSRPYPFFFAGREERVEHMRERGLSVLAAVIAQAA